MGTVIQAARWTEGLNRSSTELARIVASGLNWTMDDHDQIVDTSGDEIAYTIEDTAAAMAELGWFVDNGAGIHWSQVPDDSAAAAAAVRGRVSDGCHPRTGNRR
jgi:hypothetical protein